MRARDTSPGIVPEASDDYWRSYFDLNGQLMAVSVIGFKTSPLSAKSGLDTIRSFTKAIRFANADNSQAFAKKVKDERPAPAVAPRAITPRAVTPRSNGNLRGVGILRRLLG